LSPIEVVNLTTVMDQAEIARGEMAQQRAVSAEVQAYASRMVAEYARSRDLVQAITEPSVAGDPKAQLRARHRVLITQDLQGQTGASFDAAYISAQVSAHAEEVAMIDRSLLPSIAAAAPPPGLRAVIQEMRPMVAAHLVEALQLEQRLHQTPSSPPITPN
jgi:putative membrane protein